MPVVLRFKFAWRAAIWRRPSSNSTPCSQIQRWTSSRCILRIHAIAAAGSDSVGPVTTGNKARMGGLHYLMATDDRRTREAIRHRLGVNRYIGFDSQGGRTSWKTKSPAARDFVDDQNRPGLATAFGNPFDEVIAWPFRSHRFHHDRRWTMIETLHSGSKRIELVVMEGNRGAGQFTRNSERSKPGSN